MRYTPVELRHVRVGRSLFGYKRHDIDKLLEDVADSFEEVWRERGELADKVEDLEKILADVKEREALLAATLVSAERAAAEAGAGQEGGRADRRRGASGGAVGHPRGPGRARAALRRGAPGRDIAARRTRDGRGDEARASRLRGRRGRGGVAEARGHTGVPGGDPAGRRGPARRARARVVGAG